MTADYFANLKGHNYMLLTTYRKSGVPVACPVWFAQQGSKIYMMSLPGAGKLKRLRHTNRIELAPCKAGGRVVGQSIAAQGRIIPPEDHALSELAEQALLKKYGWFKRLYNLYRSTSKQTY